MEQTHSYSLDFIRRLCKKEKNKALLYARITVDGEEPAEISLKEKINAAAWDNQKKKVKGKGLEVDTINQHITDVRAKIKAKYRELQEREELITAEAIKAAYLGIHTKLKGHKLIELVDFFKKIWESKMAEGNFKNFKTTSEYLKRFLTANYKSCDIYLSQLNNEFATLFENYIRNNPIKEEDPCQGNGVAKHIQRFKRILNWGADAKDGIGWMKTNPCAKYSCPVKRKKRKKLTMEQLVTLENKTFKTPTLNYVKDLFLFSCYTGFAFADVMQLSHKHFEWETDGTIWCKLYRQKSDILSPVPLLKLAKKIIEKYKHHPKAIKRGAIFPKISNSHVNRCLKIIQEICEIEFEVNFHIARHTFAKTVAIKNKIPIETVQKMMGHTKITTTMIYVEVDEEKIKDDFEGLDEKLDAKRRVIIMKKTGKLQKAG